MAFRRLTELPNRLRRRALLLGAGAGAMAWLVGASPLRAYAQRGYGIADLEAAMIQKIASFVRWPASAGLERPGARFVVTVLGASPLLARLTFLYGKVSSPPAVVRAVDELADIGKCHVLFIARAYADRLPEVLDLVGDQPTLMIGDTPGMAERGVAVNLYREGDRVRFEINRRALERRGLQASYQLLSLARLVEGL